MSRKRKSLEDVGDSSCPKIHDLVTSQKEPSEKCYNTLQTTANDGLSRIQMLQLPDPLIAAFNVADFETFAKTLRLVCASDVEVVCKLIPPMPTLESSPDPPIFQQQHCLEGVSALLLLWILLRETHPDAVLQIIGKRICYRQIMENYELPVKMRSQSDVSSTDASSKRSRGYSSSPSNSVASSASGDSDSRSSSCSVDPVSILESIWKFSGSCVTTQTMDVLFTRLSNDSGLLAVANATTLQKAPSPTAAAASKQKQQPEQGQEKGKVDHDADPVALSQYISNFLTQERLRIPRGAGGISNSSRVPVRKGPDGGAGLSDAPPEPIRRYLIETRLVFNEQDLVHHWTFNLLAAESD